MTPSLPFRASVAHIIPIPPAAANLALPPLEPRKNVLALYPGTTTFYKAEVVTGWKGGSGVGVATVVKREGSAGEKEKEKKGKEEYVTLRFEGEDEVDMVNSVERRYVLPDKA